MPFKKNEGCPASHEARATKRERVARVVELLAAGVPPRAIVKQCTAEWSCAARTVLAYVQHARTKILPSWYEWGDQRAVAAELLAKLDVVYDRALAAERFHAALRALRQIAELRGLTAPQMIALERDSFRRQLEALRADNVAQGQAPGVSLRQFNAARALYGWPALTEDEFARYRKAGQKSGDPVARGEN